MPSDNTIKLANILKNFSEDFKNNPETWENITIDQFLERMSAWLKDRSSFEEKFVNEKKYIPKNIDVEFVETLLDAGKGYE